MPIYEYECDDCHRTETVFFKSFSEVSPDIVCSTCGSNNLSKRITSRVSMVGLNNEDRSETHTAGGDSANSRTPEDNPYDLARIMREATSDSRIDPGNEFNEVVTRLEKGEHASSIEKSLRKRSGRDQRVH